MAEKNGFRSEKYKIQYFSKFLFAVVLYHLRLKITEDFFEKTKMAA
jgi:hypothetical protein